MFSKTFTFIKGCCDIFIFKLKTVNDVYDKIEIPVQ